MPGPSGSLQLRELEEGSVGMEALDPADCSVDVAEQVGGSGLLLKSR